MLPAPHYRQGTYPPYSFFPTFGPPGVVPAEYKKGVEDHLSGMLQRKKATNDLLRARAREMLPQHEEEVFHDPEEIDPDMPPLEEVPAAMPDPHRPDGGDDAAQPVVAPVARTPAIQRVGQGLGLATAVGALAVAHTARLTYGLAQGLTFGGLGTDNWTPWPYMDRDPPEPPAEFPPGHPGAPPPPHLAHVTPEIPAEAPPVPPQAQHNPQVYTIHGSSSEENEPEAEDAPPLARPRSGGRSGGSGRPSGMTSGSSGSSSSHGPYPGAGGSSGSSGSSGRPRPFPWPM